MKKTKTVLSGTKAIFISLTISLAVLLLLVLICSLVISKKENPESSYFIISLVLPIVCGAGGGVLCALLGKKSGLIRGLIMGFLLGLCINLFGFIASPNASASFKDILFSLALPSVSGAFGGLIGVSKTK